jgi:hypothetical protein
MYKVGSAEKDFAEKNVQIVSGMVNSSLFDAETFCEKFQREHRTLQQNFTRLCIEWIKTCASDEYAYDGRNEASHKVCLDLCAGYLELTHNSENDIVLPFI